MDLTTFYVSAMFLFGCSLCISLPMFLYCGFKRSILKLAKKPQDAHLPLLIRVFEPIAVSCLIILLVITLLLLFC